MMLSPADDAVAVAVEPLHQAAATGMLGVFNERTASLATSESWQIKTDESGIRAALRSILKGSIVRRRSWPTWSCASPSFCS